MVEKVLHGGNIAASLAIVATAAADLTFLGGTTTLIGASLSGHALLKRDKRPDKALIKQMAKAMQDAFEASHLPKAQLLIVAQMLEKYPLSYDDIMMGKMEPAIVATKMRGHILETAKDPAHQTRVALDGFVQILTKTLAPVLKEPIGIDPMQAAFMKANLKQTDGQSVHQRNQAEAHQLMMRQQFEVLLDDLGSNYTEMISLLQQLIQEGHSIHHLRNLLEGRLK